MDKEFLKWACAVSKRKVCLVKAIVKTCSQEMVEQIDRKYGEILDLLKIPHFYNAGEFKEQALSDFTSHVQNECERTIAWYYAVRFVSDEETLKNIISVSNQLYEKENLSVDEP